jgi:predicted DNA binding CopG/RHH family protein
MMSMREEYDFSNARKNPYAKKLKKQITINIDGDTIDYFKAEAEQVGIPYQTLINLYLADCVSNNRELQLTWK